MRQYPSRKDTHGAVIQRWNKTTKRFSSTEILGQFWKKSEREMEVAWYIQSFQRKGLADQRIDHPMISVLFQQKE